MIIDTHTHLNFNAFKEDFDDVIKACLNNDIWIINVGTKYETSERAVWLANKYPEGVFAIIGLHPIHLETGLVKIKNDDEEITIKTKEQDFDYEKYKILAQDKKVVAIGEIGLDYYWKPKTKKRLEEFKAKQKDVFLKQINLAKNLNLPIMIHCRMAYNDLIDILSSFPKGEIRGVVHCFTGNLEHAKKIIDLGFYIGLNGIIFKKIQGVNFEEIIKFIPVEKILLETDAPYLTPPDQKESRNTPLNIKYIAQQIAKIKKISYKDLIGITTQSARKLFSI
jgi:TatD DNase family protein